MHCTIHVNGQRCLVDEVVIFALLRGSRLSVGCLVHHWFGDTIYHDGLTSGVRFSTALSDASA